VIRRILQWCRGLDRNGAALAGRRSCAGVSSSVYGNTVELDRTPQVPMRAKVYGVLPRVHRITQPALASAEHSATPALP
jgi:hypothetical protein